MFDLFRKLKLKNNFLTSEPCILPFPIKKDTDLEWCKLVPMAISKLSQIENNIKYGYLRYKYQTQCACCTEYYKHRDNYEGSILVLIQHKTKFFLVWIFSKISAINHNDFLFAYLIWFIPCVYRSYTLNLYLSFQYSV